MVLDAVSNFVRGTADAEVGTEDTTVSVADASIFPDPATDGEFNVVIWDANNFPRPDQDGDVEILRVTARDTTADELTVARAQEMTSEASHPEGSAIHLSPTAKMFSDIESTFGDFWDAGTQELTADVNNTNTTTQSLEAGSASINGALDAESASVEGLGIKLTGADDTSETSQEYLFESNQVDHKDAFKTTTGVSTTASKIAEYGTDAFFTFYLAMVNGVRDDQQTRFVDIVMVTRFDAEVIGTSESGSPASRTYSVEARDLQVSMASGTFDVRTRTLEVSNGV